MKSDIPKFGSREIIVFAVALLSGTASSLLSKVIYFDEIQRNDRRGRIVFFAHLSNSSHVSRHVDLFDCPFCSYNIQTSFPWIFIS